MTTTTRPRPVLTAGTVVGVVHAIAFVAGFLGFANAETRLSNSAEAIGAVIVGAVVLAAHLLAAWHAQAQVTPLADPKDALGRALVVAEQSGGEIKQLIGSVQELGRALIVPPADGSAHGDLATPVEAPAAPVATDEPAPAVTADAAAAVEVPVPAPAAETAPTSG